MQQLNKEQKNEQITGAKSSKQNRGLVVVRIPVIAAQH